MVSKNTAPARDIAKVSRQEFQLRHIRALAEVGSGKVDGPAHLVMASLPATGLVIMLVRPGDPIYMVAGSAPTAEREIRELVLNADEAWSEFIKMLCSLAPQMATEVFDKLAANVLQDIFAGSVDVGDTIWLIRWIRYRAEAPRLDFDEAQRLYGSAPRINLNGDGPVFDWEELSALIGVDKDFEHRKGIMQAIAENEFNDLMEKFAGGMSTAFLDAQLHRIGGRKH